MCRNLAALLYDFVAGSNDGRSANRQGAGAIGSHAHRDRAGVAMHHLYVLVRDAKLFGYQLCKGRFVALPMAMGAGHHRNRAGCVETDLRRLPQADAGPQSAYNGRGRNAAGFDVGGEADPPQLAAALGFGAPRGKPLIVDHLQCQIERRLVVARVVGKGDRGLVGELVRLDEILSPKFRRIHAELACRYLHDPLDQVGCLRAASSPVGIDRGGSGEDSLDVRVYRRRCILPSKQRRVEVGGHAGGEAGEVGAQIGGGVHLQRQKLPSWSSASFTLVKWSRPWASETKASSRPAVHLTGRPTFFAAHVQQVSSA